MILKHNFLLKNVKHLHSNHPCLNFGIYIEQELKKTRCSIVTVFNCLKDHSRVLGSHGIQEFRIVLADEGLLVVAGDVVPDHTVVVEVVQHAQAPLVIFTLKHRDKTRMQMPAKMFPHLKLLFAVYGPHSWF